MLLVDAGGFTGSQTGTREARTFFLLEWMREYGYDGVTLGVRDLTLGDELVRALGQGESAPLVSANLLDPATGELLFPEFRIVERGGVRVGITGVTREIPEGVATELETRDPETALEGALGRLAGKADLVVVLGDVGEKRARELGEKFAGRAHVYVLSGFTSRGGLPAVEDPRVVHVLTGSKGQTVGLTRVTMADAGPAEMRVEEVTLAPSMAEDPVVAETVDGFRRNLNDLLREQALVNVQERRKSDDGEFFLGASTCKECHAREHEIWTETPHAHAFQTLVEAGTEALPECYACHVTGHGDASGYAPHLSDAATLQNVQCEVCHDKGTAHARDGTYGTSLLMKACIRCHDPENSPMFDPEVYWLMMQH